MSFTFRRACGLALSVVASLALGTPAPVRAKGPAAANVEAAAGLTLQHAITLALSANAELAAATRELEAGDAAVMQGRARPNPELSLLLEDTRSATRTTTLQLSQPIETGGKRAARIEAAERGRDIASAELAARRAELRAVVVLAFRDVLVAQERIALADDATALAARAVDAASKRVLAGKVSPVEETRARVAESAVRLESVQAQAQWRSARLRLAALWGQSTPRFERADGTAAEPPALPIREAIEARAAASPQLRRAQLEVQRRRALAEVERARGVPDLTLSVGVKRDRELGRNQAVIGLALPLPVFDNNRGNLLEALRREDKARDELAATRTRLVSEALQAREQLGAARAEAQALQDDILPGAQSAYQASAKGFELGKFGFLDVLDAQRTLFQARAQHLNALAQAHRAAAEIDKLLGDNAEPSSQPKPGSAP
jgi:outer membrane protein, heavy metal efflux system